MTAEEQQLLALNVAEHMARGEHPSEIARVLQVTKKKVVKSKAKKNEAA